MDDETRRAFRQIQQDLNENRTEIDALTGSITRLVRGLDEEDERQSRIDKRERDDQEESRKRLFGKFEELEQRVENIGTGLRDLPEKLLATVEKKIYELRIERHEARLAGVANEPAPLLPPPTYREPPPTYREPTGRFQVPPAAPALPLPAPDDEADALALSPRTQRKIRQWVIAHWKWGVVSALLADAGRWIYTLIKNAGH